MTEVMTATAVSNKGLEGDASFGRKSRQVLLIDSETLLEFGLGPGDVRENMTLEGFEVSDLKPQDELEIGDILLLVTGDCGPCSQLDELRAGLSSEILGRRGVLARVIRGGKIEVDDPVSLIQIASA